MNHLVAAIHKLRPNAEFAFTGNDYSTIEWLNLEGKAPTKSEIEVAIVEVEAEIQASTLAKEAARQSVLDKLGLSEDEAKALLG